MMLGKKFTFFTSASRFSTSSLIFYVTIAIPQVIYFGILPVVDPRTNVDNFRALNRF